MYCIIIKFKKKHHLQQVHIIDTVVKFFIKYIIDLYSICKRTNYKDNNK